MANRGPVDVIQDLTQTTTIQKMRPILARREDNDHQVSLTDKLGNSALFSTWSGENSFLLSKSYFSFLDDKDPEDEKLPPSNSKPLLKSKGWSIFSQPQTLQQNMEKSTKLPENLKSTILTHCSSASQGQNVFDMSKDLTVDCPEEPIPDLQNDSLVDLSRKLYKLSIPQFPAQETMPDQARPSVSPPQGERTQFWMNSNKALFTPPPSPIECENNSFFEQLDSIKAKYSPPSSSPDIIAFAQSQLVNRPMRRFSHSDVQTSPTVSSAFTSVMSPPYPENAIESSHELEPYPTEIYTNFSTNYIAAYPRYSNGGILNTTGWTGQQSKWQDNGVNVSMPLNLQVHLRNRIVECAFCRKNGETREFYSTHKLKDHRGMVVCPILRKYVCPQCGATEDNAHTIRHCPLGILSDL